MPSNPGQKTAARSAILLIHCPDRPGLVATVAEFILKNHGNVLHLDQHVDGDAPRFYMRVEWDLDGFGIPEDRIGEFFRILIGDRFEMAWELHFSDHRPRMAIFASRLHHCLYDLLSRCRSGEWNAEVAVVVSNHEVTREVAGRFDVPCEVIAITPETRPEAEARQRALLDEYDVEFVVLARYMQVLSEDFVSAHPNRIINIHHSFLPAFPGARPYHSAFERGVKIIGATSHYVTSELDEGPIIQQSVVDVSHRDSIRDLIRKGRDLEKLVLARAVWHHLQRRVLVCGRRTVVFD